MLKLNASYSKKVPAGAEYSSQSYYASVEIELSDSLNAQDIKQKIHDTFELVKDSVEKEIKGAVSALPGGSNHSGESEVEAASSKQIKYLLDLAKQSGVNISELLRKAGVKTTAGLNRKQCSALIDEISGRKVA